MFTLLFGRAAAPYLARRRAAFRLRFASVLRTSLWLPFASLTLLCLPLCCAAQYKYDYQWVIGKDLVSTSEGAALLKFTENPMYIDSVPSQFEFVSCNASMCNGVGDLAFYSDGCQIADADHSIMPGGDSINPGIVHDIYCSGYNLTIQSMLPLPAALDPDKYFLFHLKNNLIPNVAIEPNELLQTTINISLNEGKGEVTEANKLILEYPFSWGELSADRKSTRLNSSHLARSRMPSSA